MTVTTGAPCWMDLLTSDTGRAREFYGRVFGWTAGEASPEFGGYFMFFIDGAPVAGCTPVITPALWRSTTPRSAGHRRP
jgi:predicted enzyme related to lactoylglutathione lyase